MIGLRIASILTIFLPFGYGYILDRNTTVLSLRLADTETNLSPHSTVFLNKETDIFVEGLSWAADTNGVDGFSNIDYMLYVNGALVQNGTVDLEDDLYVFPTSIRVGSFSMQHGGNIDIRVILQDSTASPFKATLTTRVCPHWLIGIPIVLSFALFLIFKLDIVPTLFLAMFVGSWMVEGSLVKGFKAVFSTYILGTVSESSRAAILLFIVGIHILMATVEKSGGTNEMLRIMSPYTSRARVAQLVLLSLGILTFFDPYVSILLIGTVFGSVLEGFPISAAKMAYIVDTTSLPVASVIPGSTWLAWCSSFLDHGSQEDAAAESVVASSIKYQFYPVLILAMTLLQIILSREAGPMLKGENKKRSEYGKSDQVLEAALSIVRRGVTKPERSWNWWIPVVTLNIILWTAYIKLDANSVMEGRDSSILFSTWWTCAAGTIFMVQMFYLSQVFKLPFLKKMLFVRAERSGLAFLTDTFPSGSASKSDDAEQHIDQDFGDIIGSPKAGPQTNLMEDENEQESTRVCMGCLRDESTVSFADGIACILEGSKRAIPLLITQCLAWSLGEVYLAFGVDRVVLEWILNDGLSPEMLPVATFFGSFLLTLVLGSPWTTVSVMIVVTSQHFGHDENLYQLIGSIMSGAVAGGHTSPFSDTSILSAYTTGCDVRNHVMTQLPYALPVVLLSVLTGTCPVAYGAFPEFFGFFIGFVVIFTVVIVVCRRVESPSFLPGRSSDAITKELHPLRRRKSGSSPHSYLPDGLILPVSTNELIDKEEDNSIVGSTMVKSDEIPMLRTHTLQSFKSRLKEINSGIGDPILGLVQDGLLPDDIKGTLSRAKEPSADAVNGSGHTPNRSVIENKKRLIEATIKSSEKDSNIFSESLRMFLRTAETKLDLIMSENSMDIQRTLQASKSAESGDDDSLDNLMLDIAANGWKSTADEPVQDDDGDTEVTGIGEGYTTGGGYTTDGAGSGVDESDDSASSSSSNGVDGQSTAFTTDHEDSDSNGDNTSTGTSNGPSLTASEGTQGDGNKGVDPEVLRNPLAFHKTHNMFAWMGGLHISADETETDNESAKDYTKASF